MSAQLSEALTISLFSSALDSQVRSTTLTPAGLIQELIGPPELVDNVPDDPASPEIAEIKRRRCRAWSPASYSSGTRSKKTVTTCSCLPLDLDKGTDGEAGLTEQDVDALFSWLDEHGYLYAAHTSFTSGFYAPRQKWRVVLFFSRPVTGSEFEKQWEKIAAECPVQPDPSRKTQGDIFFSPAVPRQHAHLHQAYESEGIRLIQVDGFNLGLNQAGKRLSEAEILLELERAEQKHVALNKAAYTLGKRAAEVGETLDGAAIWAKCEAALKANSASAPVKDWAAAKRTCDKAAKEGYEAERAQAENPAVQASPKQLEQAEKQLRAELKRVKSDPNVIESAAKRLAVHVPHALSEKRVREALMLAAADAENFLTATQSQPLVTKGLQEGKAQQVARKTGWRGRLLADASGEGFAACDSNAKVVLKHHEAMVGKLRWNVREAAALFTEAPPWECHHTSFPARVQDSDGYDAAQWLGGSKVLGKPLGARQTLESMLAVAEQDPFDPFADWLESLEWDGVARLDSWLVTYCGCEDSRYTRLVAKNFLLGSVALTLAEGNNVDTVLVFKGPEGIGKSQSLRILTGNDYFADNLPSLKDKDSQLIMERYVIVEIAELDKLMQYDDGDVKSFVTTRKASVRAAYARTAKPVRRRAVLAASTNQDTFLKSETGNRRFLPVTVGTFALEALRADRAQLWAEAVARFKAGEQWWMSDEDDLVVARDVQETARMRDPFEEKLSFIDGKKPTNAKYTEIQRGEAGVQIFENQFTDDGLFRWVTITQCGEYLGVDLLGNQSISKRIGKALRAKGWLARRHRVANKPTTVFANPSLLWGSDLEITKFLNK